MPSYLAGAIEDRFPHVSQTCEKCDPLFAGTVEEFVAQHAGEEGVNEQCKNKVKICAACGKPNGFTLAACNACGGDLTTTAISYSDNIFTGFIYGVQKTRFPLTISIRAQSETHLVFDDLLALSPCHLNSIPTDQYCPDIRALFEKPEEARALVMSLADEAWAVTRDSFLADPAWCSKVLKAGAVGDVEAVRSHVIAGFNYPPSQYQLHLQHMLPPLLPFHEFMYQDGKHFTHGRFTPLEYVLEALDKLIATATTLKGASKMDLPQIFAYFKAIHGLDYDQVHAECYARYGASHAELANWSVDDFTGDLEGVDKETNAADTLVLQNYGRPYTEAGKPQGTHYKHAKKNLVRSFL
jgi:hypothetical protein